MINRNFADEIQGLTLQDGYKKRLEQPQQNCIGERLLKEGKLDNFYTWYSNSQIIQKAEYIGSGLVNMDLVPEINEWRNYSLKCIGVYSKNTLNYLAADIACVLYGFTSVPIYDTLGEEATLYAFN